MSARQVHNRSRPRSSAVDRTYHLTSHSGLALVGADRMSSTDNAEVGGSIPPSPTVLTRTFKLDAVSGSDPAPRERARSLSLANDGAWNGRARWLRVASVEVPLIGDREGLSMA